MISPKAMISRCDDIVRARWYPHYVWVASKNRRRGNGNTQVCILPRASLGLLLYSAQVIFTIKMWGAITQATIPCDDLFGDVPHGTIVVAAMPFEQWSVLERTWLVRKSHLTQLFARVHSTQIAFFLLRSRRIYQASDIAKLWLEFLSARVRSTLHQTIGRAKLR